MLTRLRWSTPLLLFLVVMAIWLYPRLPEVVVSHWGFQGPDGWAPKQVFVPVLVGVAAGLQLLLGWLSASERTTRYTNIPNKSYWLAPERARRTWRRLGAYIDWTLTLLQVVMIMALHLSAAMSGAPVLLPISADTAQAVFLAAILLSCVVLPAWFFLSFRLPAEERRRRRAR